MSVGACLRAFKSFCERLLHVFFEFFQFLFVLSIIYTLNFLALRKSQDQTPSLSMLTSSSFNIFLNTILVLFFVFLCCPLTPRIERCPPTLLAQNASIRALVRSRSLMKTQYKRERHLSFVGVCGVVILHISRCKHRVYLRVL